MVMPLKYVTHLVITLKIERWRVLFQQLPVGQVSLAGVTLLAVMVAAEHKWPWSVPLDDSPQLLFQVFVHSRAS